MNPVATRIQAILDERGLQLKPLAESVGVKYYSIYPWWQRESSKADMPKVMKLADALAVSAEYLMFGEGEPEKPQIEALLEKIQGLSKERQDALYSYLEHLVSQEATSGTDQERS